MRQTEQHVRGKNANFWPVLPDVIWAVVCVPELGYDKQLIPLPLCNERRQTLAHNGLVPVKLSTIEVTVADL